MVRGIWNSRRHQKTSERVDVADRLKGRCAVVTGASQGIGAAVARRFASEGARLLLTELTEDAAEAVHRVAAEIAAEYPESGAIATVTDVTHPGACDALMAAAVDRHGHLDVLAHATAVGHPPVPATELEPNEWDRVMAVNAKGPFLLARSALPRITRPGGSIVFTGSFAGLYGNRGRAAYCASKGALRLFTQSLAMDVADDGVRVNGVAPAYVESELGERGLRAMAEQDRISVEDARTRRDAGIPMRRQAEAREVADAFVFLASAESSYVTGTWLDVSGGLVLR